MRRFLLCGALAVAIVVLASFGSSKTPAAALQATPFSYQGLPLSRAFHQPMILNAPQSVQMPPSGGVVITEVVLHGQTPQILIDINGVTQKFSVSGPAVQHTHHPNPPLIARPGDTLTITPSFQPQAIEISGYTILPGET